MATTTAKNQRDVDNMSAKDRLWDSLNYSYGKQREVSDQSYEKAFANMDNQLQGRGMQRSSYGAQVLGNLRNEQVKAQNDIYNSQIADYQNRLTQLEQQEIQNEQWERQFAANREDAAWNQNFQQAQFDANRADTEWTQNFQQNQADQSQANWQATFDAGREDTAWSQNFQQNQADQTQQNWQATFDANREDTAWTHDFQTNSQNQSYYGSMATTMLQNGQMPSDEMLRLAGISKEDAQAMLKKKSASTKPTTPPPGNEDQKVIDEIKKWLLQNERTLDRI